MAVGIQRGLGRLVLPANRAGVRRDRDGQPRRRPRQSASGRGFYSVLSHRFWGSGGRVRQSGISRSLGSRVSRSSPAVGVFSWTGGSPVVNRQRQTGGQSQVGQSDGLKDVDRVGDMRQR